MHLFLSLFALCFIATCHGTTALEIEEGSGDLWLDRHGSTCHHEDLWKAISQLHETLQTQATKLNELEQKNSQLQEEVLERQPKLCEGRTSYTQWKPYNSGPYGITVHVDTSHCQFQAVPAYFTSLSGKVSHWTTKGMTSIYDESKTGFDVYLWITEAGKDEPKEKTLAMMAVRQWELNWIGVEKNGRS